MLQHGHTVVFQYTTIIITIIIIIIIIIVLFSSSGVFKNRSTAAEFAEHSTRGELSNFCVLKWSVISSG